MRTPDWMKPILEGFVWGIAIWLVYYVASVLYFGAT